MRNIFKNKYEDLNKESAVKVDEKYEELTFNELTFEMCKPIINKLIENELNFVIFGGFAIFLQMIRYNNEISDIFDVIDNTRKTEDMDILVPSVKSLMDLLTMNEDTMFLVDKEVYERHMDLRTVAEDEVSTGIKLEYNRGADILTSIQGYSLDNIEYDIIEYGGFDLKVASVETLLNMKISLVNMYKTGAREKDLSDTGLLQMIKDGYDKSSNKIGDDLVW